MKTVLVPVTILIMALFASAYAATNVNPPAQTATLPDLAVVSQVEVRGADGAVVLAGQFGAATTEDGETERDATLTAAGAIAGATGTAEIELTTRGQQTEREFELDVEGLPAKTPFTLVIDGQTVATFTTDAEGEAEVELKDVR
jgi:hypothetical protein